MDARQRIRHTLAIQCVVKGLEREQVCAACSSRVKLQHGIMAYSHLQANVQILSPAADLVGFNCSRVLSVGIGLSSKEELFETVSRLFPFSNGLSGILLARNSSTEKGGTR